MLHRLTLQNFKGFEKHTLDILPFSVIVGKNNAGKSTIVDALKLVSIITKRYKNLSFVNTPSNLDIPRRFRGVVPSTKGLNFTFTNVCYHYGDPPAIITAFFTSGESIEIYVSPEQVVFAVLKTKRGRIIKSRAEAQKIILPRLRVLPQVAPLADEERALSEDYVLSAADSAIASQHFRNQLHFLSEHFDHFLNFAEETWPGLRIRDLAHDGGNLRLIVQDERFVSEVGWMGHGLQIWLQVIWFLSRTTPDEQIVLDEPDVYLHADLQRKLIRMLRQLDRPTIIATHSIEILSEVEPRSVLVIDKKRSHSNFANHYPAVQKVIDTIGGVHNIHLAKLVTSQRLLAVEGKDIRLLKAFQDVIFPDTNYPMDTIPFIRVGGWHGWNYAIGSSMLLENAAGERIYTYCILDRDYRTEDEIGERINDALRRGVRLWVWRRKEIENYLINSSVVQRVITQESSRGPAPTVNEVQVAIDALITELRDEISDNILTEVLNRNRSKGPKHASRVARTIVTEAWRTEEGRLRLVPGKILLSNLSQWAQENYQVSVSDIRLARAFRKSECNEEVVSVVSAIEKCEKFN